MMNSFRWLLVGLITSLTCVFLYVQNAVSSENDEFQRVNRPGSVNLEQEYSIENLQIPKEQIHTLLPRDAIPALTDPKMEPASKASWLPDDARIIVVTVGRETIGVPLRVLDWHEIVNTTVGGRAVAVTYCPLCDSAAVFSRELPAGGASKEDEKIVLEFGVSGALFNSNVLMYDRRDRGLWSQLGMKAVSGPLAGTTLDTLPFEIVSFGPFKKKHALAQVVSRDTGHERDYFRSPYDRYFSDDSLMVPVAGMGSALPRKTLGVGIAVGEGDTTYSWFVPVDAIGSGKTLHTPAGEVRLGRNEAGIAVIEAPPQVRTAQTFYYSWSAFYPNTKVVGASESTGAERNPTAPGLSVGDRAPDAALTTVDGKTVQLRSLYRDGPIVLTFYRGGWCPICNRALSNWRDKLDALKAAGGTFVALSPEKPDHLARTIEKGNLNYTVLSDPKHEAARRFRVHFAVDEETKTKYEKHGLDVGEANVSGTWELPAPATFVIDAEGVVRYAFADWDYRKRADPDEVINAVRELTRGK